MHLMSIFYAFHIFIFTKVCNLVAIQLKYIVAGPLASRNELSDGFVCSNCAHDAEPRRPASGVSEQQQFDFAV